VSQGRARVMATRRGRPAAAPEARARRKEEILACATGVFAERGYPGTDMQAIADSAGVAKGTLYLYFTSKEELFLAAADLGFTRMREAVQEVADLEPDPLRRIRVAVRAYLRHFRDHPEQVELMLQERAEFRSRKSTYFLRREVGRDQWRAMLR